MGPLTAQTKHERLGVQYLQLSPSPGIGAHGQDIQPRLMFTENDTNFHTLYGSVNPQPYVKDAFHRRIVDNQIDAINPDSKGTKSCAWYAFDDKDGIPPGECAVVRFRLSKKYERVLNEEHFDDMIEQRRLEADEFYWRVSPLPMAEDLRNIQRQAFSGLMWCKQYYHFVWDQWANGDKSQPPPPPGRKAVRNQQWKHMYLDDVLSMPDSWEYPYVLPKNSSFLYEPLQFTTCIMW